MQSLTGSDNEVGPEWNAAADSSPSSRGVALARCSIAARLPGTSLDVRSVLPPSPRLSGTVFGDGCYSAGGLAVPWSASRGLGRWRGGRHC